MKVLATCFAVLALTGIVYLAHAADGASRPPGIEARNWYRLSDRLGFVVLAGDADRVDRGIVDGGRQVLRAAPENLGADLLPPLKGYFVVQSPTGWRAIVMSDPVALTR